ncbi:putative 2OG-Fe(II) oxygenase [Citromicrobium bathyomarinum]|uniref:putative 2OG-Fe(II) oxygenase n=1 Tax=Citromicrobium bathyomarinum TaxID=72174 RepID=UPI003159DF3A
MSTSPREWHERAIAAERGGSPQEAERIITEGLGEHPREAELHNSAGNLAMRRRDFVLAAERFAAAARIAPTHLPFAINEAIARTQGGAPDSALAALAPYEDAGRADARYCTTRANAARLAGDPAMASEWYDRALALDRGNARALAGRARIALERNEANAVARIDTALAREPGDPHLWLSKAQALDLAGDLAGAQALTRQIVDQAPTWRDGLDLLAQLRLAAGDADFDDHFAEAARKAPSDRTIPIAHTLALAAVERFAEATEIATQAQTRFPEAERFVLFEASFASAAGDDARAENAFGKLREDTLDRAQNEARHRLRTQDWAAAQTALDRAFHHAPFDGTTWALAGMLWRVTDDPRAEWLHGQEGLVRLIALTDAQTVLPPAIALLEQIHATATFPIGQSLRGGTQTRGILFNRKEPELAALRDALLATLDEYRAGLPAADPQHPLLRLAHTPWALAGSWSVRLTGGRDHHASHTHPQGLLSSALYLLLPPTDDAHGEGALELGRPPPDLRLDLPPLHVIRPQEGHLALFPSTLFHGTTPFTKGARMTVAFDVVARGGPG